MSLPAGQGSRASGLRAFVAVAVAILAVVGAISCVLGFVRSVRDVREFSAEIGDCVAGETAEDARIVTCEDPAARRRVVDSEIRPSPVTEEVLNEACSGSPAADDVFWKTFESGQVLILCLETLRP
ncbi:hypothetical protein SAMN05444365_11616 [Micromonospora pattaloongensis]|uniref:Uncharacterized protein n=1 Tax=Micromonospora pattaloongensis TaxID=405436 RepID=A0A1H3SZG8_9ACTN|nr:hypothetical protein [Micromonospora pattaloongensis]SDZ43426.1 hypothetical protein SAMN05444365_11616 [Micromonospora pattaloongensis]